MRDILSDIQSWIAGGERFALARVVKTWGSAPRGVGSAMAVTGDRKVVGSVSGGCIEGEVIEAARRVLESGRPEWLRFGVSDETAWSVGLTCGGKVEVFVELHPAFTSHPNDREIWQRLEQALTTNQPVVWLTRLQPDRPGHLLIFPDDAEETGDWGRWTSTARELARQAYARRESTITEIEGEPVFIHVFPRKDRLLVIGAAHISIPLVKFARELEFEVVVIDPRGVFATRERFPVPPDQLITQWPDRVLPELGVNEDTYAVLLTHDPKIDDVALHYLLRSEAAYIGALGSRKTHAKRCRRLREAGFSEEEIARIRGPVGIEIGARTPTEIALSIMAEVVAARRRPANVTP